MLRTRFRPFALALGFALAVAGLAAPVTAVAPASAAAPPGTLVFIKNHNVWMSKGDGTGQVQVTKNAIGFSSRYSSPTMSDSGIITALRDTEVMRMRTDGTVLSSWDAGTLLPVAEGGIQGTSALVVSPDGSKVAYSQTSWKGLGHSVNVGTRFSASDRNASAGAQEISRSGPKWVTNSRVLLRSWGTIYLRDTASSASQEWFSDEDFLDMSDCGFFCFGEELWAPELSRDGTRLIAMRGPTSSPQMIVYTVSGNARTGTPPKPTITCTFGTDDNDELFDVPTIAPDNRAIAWQMAEGVFVKNNMSNCGVDDVRLAVAGASEPFWSAAAYRAPATPKSLSAKKSPAISGTAKVGKTLKASAGTWNASPSKVAYQWKRNGKAIKGATKAKYRAVKADAGKKLTVTVTASRSGYKSASKTSSAKAIAFANAKKPKISGTAKVGKKLKAKKGTWLGSPAGYSYQWYRGSKKIAGAKKSSYTVKSTDQGKKIRVKVTAKRSGFPSTSAYSAYTKKAKR